MSEAPKAKRLSKVAREFNVGLSTIVDFLGENGIKIDGSPNSKIEPSAYALLQDEFADEKSVKEESKNLGLNKVVRETISLDEKVTSEKPIKQKEQDTLTIRNMENVASSSDIKESKDEKESFQAPRAKSEGPTVIGKIELDERKPAKKLKEEPKPKEEKKEEKKAEKPEPEAPKEEAPKAEPEKKDEVITAKVDKLNGPTVVGKIELPVEKKKEPVASSSGSTADNDRSKKKKRKRIATDSPQDKRGPGNNRGPKGRRGKQEPKPELSPEEIQNQVRETLARLSDSGGKSKAAKHRRAKRDAVSERLEEEAMQREEDKKILRVTEFVTANELGSMMDVSVNEIISACMSLGLFVSINQRLDAETLDIVAEEFGYTIEFTSAEGQEVNLEQEDPEGSLKERAPIVTVMGHVDHGKTSLLDYIRKANVIAGEAGGITQHIGAYSVEIDNGKRIAFLDTPGHEAFTAMRARGAQVTDVAIIIIAADDSVMPQTKEAINHAKAAEVPMVFAINKVDVAGANPDKIREELSQLDILVEDWGGKYQCQEISAKKGIGIEELLEKVLLEAELLELKANPDKNGVGTVIESTLDKGRGYVTTVMVQAGTLRVGDIMLAGSYSGKVKAMHNERGQAITEVGPSTPVSILGLNGAANAGDRFNIMDDEREAKQIASKRYQLMREQGVRAQKHITLDEIGRRLAIGDFQELNVIVKADVDGSAEALADSLLKLSTEQIQVNVIHKSVGQISESDVLLASASNAIIIGFQVRPSGSARKLAEKEEIDVRMYSVIYDAIDEVKSAMEGMLAPKFEEKVVCNVEVRETFKISKVGTIAGCYVIDGKINRNTKVRIIRDGVVVYTGELGSLKRFKDDVKEVGTGYECGLNIDKFNDIKVGDVIEGYEEVEIKQKL